MIRRAASGAIAARCAMRTGQGGSMPKRVDRAVRVSGIPGGAGRGRAFWITLVAAALGLIALGPSGCHNDDDCISCGADHEAPAAPRGLYSVTGDDLVTLAWLANTETDLAGYRVYWSQEFDDPDHPYQLITTIPVCDGCYWMEFEDIDARNGETYFYAVAAYDHAGNESDLSAEYVWDTPRPDGHASIGNALRPDQYDRAGFDLHARQAVPADDPSADLIYTYDELNGGFLVAGSDYYGADETTQIQDMGFTGNFDEISVAPENVGWSPSGTAEPIAGHTYVLLTRDDHYAKIRITSEPGALGAEFDWAFQTVGGNVQLHYPAGK
jgi:hypothetical protein